MAPLSDDIAGTVDTPALPGDSLREGVVRDLRNGEITSVSAAESDNGGVLIQTCISAAAGPCDIDH